VPPSEDNTLLFDVGPEFWAVDDEVAAVGETVDDGEVDVVSEVEPGVTPTDGADLVVEPVDDCRRDVVTFDASEPAV